MDRAERYGFCAILAVTIIGIVTFLVIVYIPPSEQWQTVYSGTMAYSPDLEISTEPLRPASYQDLYVRMTLTFPDVSFRSYDTHYQIGVNIHEGLQAYIPILDVPEEFWGENVLVEVDMRHGEWRLRDENRSLIWPEDEPEVIYLTPLPENASDEGSE